MKIVNLPVRILDTKLNINAIKLLLHISANEDYVAQHELYAKPYNVNYVDIRLGELLNHNFVYAKLIMNLNCYKAVSSEDTIPIPVDAIDKLTIQDYRLFNYFYSNYNGSYTKAYIRAYLNIGSVKGSLSNLVKNGLIFPYSIDDKECYLIFNHPSHRQAVTTSP